MRAYIKCLSLVLVLVSVFSCVSLYSVGAEGAYTKPEEFIYGDVDMDGVVTVKDATAIQKGLAELEYLTAVQRYLADPNGEGVTVKSATAIQKHIAGLGGGSSIDEIIELIDSEEYLSKFSFDGYHFIDRVSVKPKDINAEYTLADFPEYDFTHIKMYYYDFDNFPDVRVYELFFESSGDEDLKNVIKSLAYRTDLDLQTVELSVFDVPAG